MILEGATSTWPRLLLLGAPFTVLALLSPKAALYVLLPTIALAPEMQVGSVVLRPDDLMLTVLLLSWGLRRLGTRRQGTPLDRPLWIYFAVGLVATLWGAAIGTADLQSLNQYSASGLHLAKRLQFVLYFLCLTDLLRSVTDVRRFTYLFMASLAALSLYSLGRFSETGRIALAPIGAAIHEPGLAAMLNVALALGLLVASKRVATSVVSGSVLIGSLWVLPFSLGRNFIVATIAMLGLVALSSKRALLLLLPVAWMIAPLVFPEHVLDRLVSVTSAFSPSAVGTVSGASVYVPSRLEPGLLYGREVMTSSPLLGWGLGSVPLGSVDSEYAWQLVTTGLLGFVVFLWLIVRVVRMTRETHQAAGTQQSPALPFVAGLQYGLLGYALYSIFSPSISAARAGAFFFTILGLLAILHRELCAQAPGKAGSAP
jgi:hypothetical protein